MEPRQDFTIGCDPEFAATKKVALLYAGEFLSSVWGYQPFGDGEKGKDVFSSYQFGKDGYSFEVRPPQSEDPLQLVENISDVLRRGITGWRDLGKLKWIAGAYYGGQPLGGHIHFGTGSLLPHREAVDVLDSYLGAIVTLIDGKPGAMRRKNGYGQPGGLRDQGYGFEYRTPGSWLTSPYVAAACLCLGKTIISEMLNNKQARLHQHATLAGVTVEVEDSEGFGYKKVLSPAGAIARNRVDVLRERFPAIWDDITQMALYQEYKPYLDVLYFLVTNKLTWYPRVSMKQAWGLEDIQLPMPRSVPLDAIWSRYREKVCHG